MFYSYGFFFFSSPILSGPRLDLYRTSTHDVALVQISYAGPKCAARCLLNIQVAKICNLLNIAEICPAVSSQVRHVSTVGKNLLNTDYVLHVCSQYGELWPSNGWDRLTSMVHCRKFQRVLRLASLLYWRRSTEVNQTLHNVLSSPGLVHYIYIFGVGMRGIKNWPTIIYRLKNTVIPIYSGILWRHQS